MNVADYMLLALEDTYGTKTLGDGYMRWVQDNGPDWDSIVTVIETATGLPFVDGWAVYWADGDIPVPVPPALLFSGDPLSWFGDPLVFNP